MFKHLITSLKPILRRHWKISLLGLIIVVALAVTTIFSYSLRQTSPTSKPTFPLNHQDISVGQTTHQQLIDKIGLFQYQYQQNGFNIYVYPTLYSTYTGDRFYLVNDMVALKELNYNPNQYILNKAVVNKYYGDQFTTLYLPLAEDAPLTTVQFYQQQGLSIYIRQDNSAVTKIQYFAPISLDTFKSTWGKGLLDTQPTPRKDTPQHTEPDLN